MDTLGIVDPQYWLQHNANLNFEQHYVLIKNHYYCEYN
jgi:hypothetical protein